MARILRCTTSRTALCGDCLTVVSKGVGRGGGEGGCLCTTLVPEGLNKYIKINTNGRGAAVFPKVTGFRKEKKKIF